ncbi:MAG: glycosyltransferase family A protein [bacterium]
MISIIIPIYNQAAKLPYTLDSLAKQEFKDFEIIIVNDGSTDGAEAAVENFLASHKNFDNQIAFFNQENKGAPAARNNGFRRSAGEYILFCDADAILTADALMLMKKTLDENSEASYAYSSFMWGKKLFKVGPFDEKKLKSGPMIHTMALVRRNDLPKSGWDESIKKLQDWDLWLTMLEDGKTGIWIDKVLFTIAPGGHISNWVPSFAYKVMPWLSAVKKYKQAFEIVKAKHKLV